MAVVVTALTVLASCSRSATPGLAAIAAQPSPTAPATVTVTAPSMASSSAAPNSSNIPALSPTPAAPGSGSSGSSSGSSSGAAHPVVEGNHFIDARTKEIWIPRGVNYPSMGYACAQNWGFSYDEANGLSETETARAIASWKTNIVRLPLNQDCWNATNGSAEEYSGQKYIAAVTGFVDQLNDAGLVVLLDLHSTKKPGAPDKGAAMLAMPDTGAIEFWTSVASTFADNPAIMFDAFNEPYAIYNDATDAWQFQLSWECWRDGGCDVPVEEADARSFSGSTYKAAGMAQLVRAIRDAGAPQPILLGGLDWANDLDGWLDHRPDDDQLVASLHSYAGQKCAAAECWNGLVTTVAAEVPVLVGEFGSTNGDDQADARYLQSLMDWADGAGIGYIIWAWWEDEDPDADYLLLADTDGTPAAPVGTTFHEHLAGLGG